MTTRLETLKTTLQAAFGQDAAIAEAFGEITLEVPADQWLATANRLRTDAGLRFESCIDLCGVDYLTYGNVTRAEAGGGACGNSCNAGSVGNPVNAAASQTEPGAGNRRFPGRYAVVAHLLSFEHNWRLRLRTWAADDEFPLVASLIECWPSVNWFEREAFDLYGIVFEGHPDLRRILTDYGFIGHPFRKDFPLSGTVEMRYDDTQHRVVYQPVTIDPREITPRIVREDSYGVGR